MARSKTGWENPKGHSDASTAQHPPAPGPLRSRQRARRLWCRLRGQHQGRALARHPAEGAPGARQPDPSRSLRMRSANRRRRRRADAGSARVFRPRGGPARVRAASAGRVRGRAGFFAARSRAAQGGRGDSRVRGARGGTAAARMAHGADYRERLRRHRAARTARGAPSVYRTRRWNHGCRGAGAQALRDSQNHHPCGRLARARRRRALLLLQSLGRDDRVQGPAHLEPDSPVLSRPQRPGDQDRACNGASAVFDQHLPELGPRASVPLPLPQRRDQHAARQYQLDGRAAGTVRLAAIRRRHAKAAADHRADRQRLLHVR